MLFIFTIKKVKYEFDVKSVYIEPDDIRWVYYLTRSKIPACHQMRFGLWQAGAY
ncbi:hypothetical protein D1AOALGA4SA_10528 [Olavius algarvensis Delta 1 endosymbiont]|nr:hypothetical protein D1AOALGA4SA_10528 [Olavius algarvensis Delta 1 endosymbiont]